MISCYTGINVNLPWTFLTTVSGNVHIVQLHKSDLVLTSLPSSPSPEERKTVTFNYEPFNAPCLSKKCNAIKT